MLAGVLATNERTASAKQRPAMNGGGAFYTSSSPHMTVSHPYASPAPATSSATLNSILTTTASPRVAAQQFQHHNYQQRRHQESPTTIPTKRKVQDMSQSPTGTTYQLDDHVRTPRPNNGHSTTPTTSNGDVSSEAVDCICGFAIDDGYSIACDICSRWCHSACFGIAPGQPVPESFMCWACSPRSQHDKETAIALQRERLGNGLLGSSGVGLGLGFGGRFGAIGEDGGKHRRRVSPSTERKARRGSTALPETAGPARKRRRPSVVQPVALPPTPVATAVPQPPTWAFPSSSHMAPPLTNGVAEEEHVDIDTEPYTSTYVPITKDIIPDDETRSKLRRQARAWRGITAVSSTPPPQFVSTEPASTIAIRPLPATPSPLLPSTNTLCLPPSYAAYTTRPLPSSSMVVPFHSLITPSSSYLREPTNGYAGLGMPKPHVHLLGPPLGVALDARGVGNEGRFVRWGCRPNAMLRPVICREGTAEKGGVRWEQPQDVDEDATEDEDVEADQERRSRRRAEKARAQEEEENDKTLGFAVFALRDLKEGEEVVLGWEWDDGHAIHRLPALLKTPGMFPPAELIHLRNQLSNILHALASTFTTCACGSSTKDCAVVAMAKVLDRLEEAGANVADFDFNDWRSDTRATEDEGRQERHYPAYYDQQQQRGNEVDLGPLIGRKRGFRTRERVPYSGGLGGMEEVDEEIENHVNGKEDKIQEHRGRKEFVISATPATPKAKSDYTFTVVSPEHVVEKRGKGKGKERAIDTDMMDGDDMEVQKSMLIDDDHRKGELPRPGTFTHSTSSSHAHPNLEPRPPDPPDDHKMFPTLPEDQIPPKMRKKRMYRREEALKRQELRETSDVGYALNTAPAPSPDTEVQIIRVGLGIQFPDEEQNQGSSAPTPPPNRVHDSLADQHDRQNDTHQEDVEKANGMPPPPLPAPRDLAALDSQNASPSTPASPPSPDLATPSPPTDELAGRAQSPKIVHPESHEEPYGDARGDAYVPHQPDKDPPPVATSTVSPVHGFANLSLMSPAMMIGEQARMGRDLPVGAAASAQTSEEVGNAETGDLPSDSEDVYMAFGGEEGRDESGREDELERAVQPQAATEAAESEQELEWSPLRRVDREMDGQPEDDIIPQDRHVSAIPEPGLVVPATDRAPPLDSVASTPPAGPSPAPVITNGDQVKEDELKEDEPAYVDTSIEMVVDDHTRSLSVHGPSPNPSEPLDVPPDVNVPPPSHFFDTDDEEEWKRQMAGTTPHVHRASPAREASPSSSLPEQHTEIEEVPELSGMRERTPSEASSRSATPLNDGSREDVSRDTTMEVDEPPPASTTTVNSEPPPVSTTSSTSPGTLPIVVEISRPAPQIPPLSTTAVTEVPSATSDATASPTAPVPRQESHEPTSPAVQAPKVKLSLRDFALRKKKRREEMEATKSSQASPMSVTSALAMEEGEADGGATPKSSVASPAVPSVLPRWVREPVAPSTRESASEAVKVKEGPVASSDTLFGALVDPCKADNLAEIARRNVENLKAFQESTKNSVVKPGWLSELSKTCEELTGSVKVLEAVAASTSPATSTSFARPPTTVAPSTSAITPAPSILTSKPIDHSTVANGYIRYPGHAPLPSPLSTKEPLLLPARPSPATSHPPSALPTTREAKKEMIDIPISNLSAPRLPTLKADLLSNPTSYLAPPRPSPFAERSISPISPDLARPFYTRPSHEDGEIGEASPPFIFQRGSGANSTPIIPKNRHGLTALQSHSPPTGPRALIPPSGSPMGGGSLARPLPPPPGSANGAANTTINTRPPPPSAPRALRQSMLSNRVAGPAVNHTPSTYSTPFGGSQYIPRGPSADRDRERERDWEHRHYRGRRGGGGGRGR